MFIIQCSNCGRTFEWKTGSQGGRMAIELSGTTVIFACGHGISEVANQDVLRDFNVPDVSSSDDNLLDPRD